MHIPIDPSMQWRNAPLVFPDVAVEFVGAGGQPLPARVSRLYRDGQPISCALADDLAGVTADLHDGRFNVLASAAPVGDTPGAWRKPWQPCAFRVGCWARMGNHGLARVTRIYWNEDRGVARSFLTDRGLSFRADGSPNHGGTVTAYPVTQPDANELAHYEDRRQVCADAGVPMEAMPEWVTTT